MKFIPLKPLSHKKLQQAVIKQIINNNQFIYKIFSKLFIIYLQKQKDFKQKNLI